MAVEGEVLAAHDGVEHLGHTLLAEGVAGDGPEERDRVGVVAGHGVSEVVLDMRLAAIGAGHVPRDLVETALGQLLLTYRYEANIVGGTIIIIFGLFLTGLFNIPWFQRELRFHGNLRGGHPLTAYVLGLAFAFGWTPCIGPVLGAILTVSAVSPAVSSGVALLGVYSLGLGVPFLLAAVFTGAFLSRLKAMRRVGRPLQIGAGVVLIIMGIAMITGRLSTFAYWLLKTFPGLATIG